MDNPLKSEDPSAQIVPWLKYFALAGVCAAIVWFYAVSADTITTSPMGNVESSRAYYNLLVDGFRSGHLYLKREVSPSIAQLPNPYDPQATEIYSDTPYELGGIHDMSYYRGKLYLYFGATPALVLFWPYVAVSHHYLSHRQAVVIFLALGLVAGAGLLYSAWNRYFQGTSFAALLAGVSALGLATGIPIVIERPNVWEVPICCGYAMVMLALGALWRALHEPARASCWLLLASLAYGLAVGARPSLLFGAIILLGPIIQAWIASGVASQRRWRTILPLLAAAMTPIFLIGLGMLCYNHQRFGNPFDFGQNYQLAGDGQNTRRFSTGNLWFNFFTYFLAPAKWSQTWPFVHGIKLLPLLPRHCLVEYSFGILTNSPFVWLALAAPWAWRDQPKDRRSLLRWFTALVAAYFIISATTIGLFYGNCVRYQLDFVPALMLVAGLGLMGLEQNLARQVVWRAVARMVCFTLLLFSIGFNLLYGVRRHMEIKCSHDIALIRGDHDQKGISLAEACLQLVPDYAEGHNYLGLVFSKMPGRLTDAVVQYEAALRINPASVETHDNLGNALSQMPGRLADAVAQYEAALRIDPGSVETHDNLGNALSQMPGRLADAVAQYEAALRINPASAEAHYNLGNAWLNVPGRLSDAMAEYQAALRIKPAFADAHNNLGIALAKQGRLAEARAQIETALRIEPNRANAYRDLGAISDKESRIEEAMEDYRHALRCEPNSLDARFKLAVDLGQLGRLGEAIDQYREVLRATPDAAMVHYNLGNALAQSSRFTDALGEYKITVQLKPDCAEAYNNLGNTLLQLGRLPEAIQQYELALRFKPGFTEARNNLELARKTMAR